MQALKVLTQTSEPTLERVQVPKTGPDDVLIKVIAAGLTPGVVKLIRQGRSQIPSIVGHEAAGEVAEVGRDVTGLQDASPLYEQYHDGTVAEYVRVPHWLVDPLPSSISMEVGAKVHDIATALRALKLAGLGESSTDSSTIVLTATTGAMGTLTLRLAKLFPCIQKMILVGRSKQRMEEIRGLTSIRTEVVEFLPNEEPKIGALVPQLKALAPEGIDVILDYVPSGHSLSQILPALRTGGTVVHMGGNSKPLAVPLVVIMAQCWRIVGSRANTREDAAQVIKWLAEGLLEVEDLITHRFKLADIDGTLKLLDSRSEPIWLSIIQVAN